MEGYGSWDWFNYSSPNIIVPLLFALSIWFSRGNISKRPWLWYVWLALVVVFVVSNVYGELARVSFTPHVPLILRVTHYLSLAALAIVVLAVRPRKKS